MSSRGPCPPGSLVHADLDELSQGNLEVGFRPQRSMKAGLELLPGAGEEQLQRWTRPAVDTNVEAMSGPETSSPTEFRSCCPGWRSAFYEADCFGTDVSSYAEELSWQASGSPDTSTHNPVSAEPCRYYLGLWAQLWAAEDKGQEWPLFSRHTPCPSQGSLVTYMVIYPGGHYPCQLNSVPRHSRESVYAANHSCEPSLWEQVWPLGSQLPNSQPTAQLTILRPENMTETAHPAQSGLSPASLQAMALSTWAQGTRAESG